MKPKHATPPVHAIRPMRVMDIPSVADIARQSFKDAWDEKQFRQELKAGQTTGVVVTAMNRVVGFILYDVNPDGVLIGNVAVHPHERRRQCGSRLVQYAVQVARENQIECVTSILSDTNMPAHLFLRYNGFTATAVFRDLFGDGHDGYAFEVDLSHPDRS